MIRLAFALIAKGLSVDREKNTLSIFEVLEQVNTTRLPAIIPEFCLVALFERAAEDVEDMVATFDFVLPSGGREALGEVDVLFQGKKRNRLSWKIRGFPIKERGIYKFHLAWNSRDGQLIGETEISLEVRATMETQEQEAPTKA